MRRFLLAVAGLGLLTVMTGCGGGDFADKSADDIADITTSDMGDLVSVHVSGSVTSQGQDIDLDLTLGKGGTCSGTVGIGGGTVQLLGTGGTTWMKPDEAFWRSTADDSADQVIAAVGDKWVVIPAAARSLEDLCDLDGLVGSMLDEDQGDPATYAKKGTAEVDGQPVVLIDSTDQDGTSTGSVLADAPHHLVRIERAGPDTGSVTFTDFDEDLDVVAPAPSDIFDLDSLG